MLNFKEGVGTRPGRFAEAQGRDGRLSRHGAEWAPADPGRARADAASAARPRPALGAATLARSGDQESPSATVDPARRLVFVTRVDAVTPP